MTAPIGRVRLAAKVPTGSAPSEITARTAATFLTQLEEPDRRALLERGIHRRFAAGSALCHQRQIADRVLVILRGRVKIASVTEQGREAILAVRGPGDLVGELAALDGGPYSATVMALDDVEALALSTESFRSFVAERPKAMFLLFGMLAARLREATDQQTDFTRFDTMGRVAARLLQLVEQYGTPDEAGHVRIDLPLTQDDLAGWTGASREAVGKALGALRECGWVQTGRRRIIVTDVSALQRLIT